MIKTVLIVEDDNFLQELEAKELQKVGYNILTAKDSEEAYKIMNGLKPIDLVVLDLLLPEVDGFAILEKIRTHRTLSRVPVIIFSNLSEEKDVVRAENLGISGFMVKSNFTLDQLASKVRELLG